MTIRPARAVGALTALLLLGGAAACSSTDSASDKTTTTTAGTSTTEKDTDTTARSSGESALERLAKGEVDVNDEEEIADAREELSAQVGIDFTDEETECLVNAFLDDPSLADIGDSPTQAEASQMMEVISSCIPKQKFVDLVIDQMDNGAFTQSQLDCIEEQLLTLSSEDMALLMAEDPEATAEFGTLVAPCENA